MKYEFEVYQMEVEKHLFWVAKSKALKGCVGQGETSEEAIKELELNEEEWLTTAAEYGIPIPPLNVRTESAFSGKVSLRFSPFTHEEACRNAKDQGVSLNQYINDAIVYYNSLLSNSRKSTPQKAQINSAIEWNTTSIIAFDPLRRNNSKLNFQISEELEEM